jgi:[CysO sulfur-carrier protein]-S-L-cysteine hydrolase
MQVTITRAVADEMIAHCLAAYPLEGCGLLAAAPNTDELTMCYPTRNAAESARVYTIDPKDHLRADRDADDRGLEITGVFHSHTHTHAYPSPTDVAQAPVPSWHYVLVSFEHDEPQIRSFRILDGNIEEESLVISE